MTQDSPRDAAPLISGYLDDMLSEEEHTALSDWIKTRPENARQFAFAAMLHDRLRNDFVAATVASADESATTNRAFDEAAPLSVGPPNKRQLWFRSVVSITAAVAVLLLASVVWMRMPANSVAASEIQRLIESDLHLPDRTYRIEVEENRPISREELPDDAPERSRPAKTPIDGAVLHVRGGGQFVLIRRTASDGVVITGCNGRESWSVNPRGKVKTSAEPTEFNRDVPGHEHSMPLINLNEGLERLRSAYEVQLLPVEEADQSQSLNESSRLLVAVRRRGERGPKRVEIEYEVRSGLIRQMRFVDMPYGPNWITLRMTLVTEQPLGENFFHHESHQHSSRDAIAE